MKAELHNFRQSPRKFRMTANLIKGKTVSQALAILTYLPKRSSKPLSILIKSAVANAKNNNGITTTDLLTVKDLEVNSGQTMKRMMPGSRGRGFMIAKKTSRVYLSLEQKEPKVKKLSAKTKKQKK